MIELPKIEGYNKDVDNPLLVKWINVRSENDMADLKNKDDLPEEILRALDELDKLSLDPNKRMEALNKEMWIRDQIVLINMVKNAEIDGFAKGKAEGKAEVKAEGKAEVAQKMKALGIDLEIIIQATGLSKADIERL